MIDPAKMLIFVHIPRCGGTSIENLLFPRRTEDNLWMGFVDPYHNRWQTGGLQHLMAWQIREEVGEAMFNACYRFAIVRNPYARAVSQYVYTMTQREDLREFAGIAPGAGFREYLKAIQRVAHVQWTPAHEFVYWDGELLVDDVFKLEEISGIKPLLVEYGLPPEIPQHNRSTHRPWREYYDDETRGIVREMYAEDFRRFGYAE